MAQENDSIAALRHFITSQGGFIHPALTVQPHASTTERGLFTTESLSQGEIVLEIPYHCLVTTDVVCECPVNRELLIDHFDSSLELQHALFLLQQQQLIQRRDQTTATESEWQCYFNVLPSDLSLIAVLWPRDCPALHSLRGTSTFTALHSRRRALQNLYQVVHNKLDTLGYVLKCSRDEFVKANMMVSSRAFGLNAKQQVFVTFADFLNHSFTHRNIDWSLSTAEDWSKDNNNISDTEYRLRIQRIRQRKRIIRQRVADEDRLMRDEEIEREAKTVYVYETRRAIEAGEELFGSYGNFSSSHFLINYGFTLPFTIHDTADIVYHLPRTVDCYCDKNARAAECAVAFGNQRNATQLIGSLSLLYSDSKTREVFETMRVFESDEQEWQIIQSIAFKNSGKLTAISRDNECRVQL